jgi:hypothetical protein
LKGIRIILKGGFIGRPLQGSGESRHSTR